MRSDKRKKRGCKREILNKKEASRTSGTNNQNASEKYAPGVPILELPVRGRAVACSRVHGDVHPVYHISGIVCSKMQKEDKTQARHTCEGHHASLMFAGREKRSARQPPRLHELRCCRFQQPRIKWHTAEEHFSCSDATCLLAEASSALARKTNLNRYHIRARRQPYP